MFNFKTFMQKSPQQRFLLILGLAMFIFYLVLGGMLIVGKLMDQIEPKYRIVLGCLFIIYAFFRFIRLMNQKPEGD